MHKLLAGWAIAALSIGSATVAFAQSNQEMDRILREARDAGEAAAAAAINREIYASLGIPYYPNEYFAEIPGRATVTRNGQKCSMHIKSRLHITKNSKDDYFSIGFGGNSSPTLENADFISLSIIFSDEAGSEVWPERKFRYIELDNRSGTFFVDLENIDRFASARKVSLTFGENKKNVVTNDLTDSAWAIAELRKCLATAPN